MGKKYRVTEKLKRKKAYNKRKKTRQAEAAKAGAKR